MADVKWIKIATEIFDNRKIKQIENMTCIYIPARKLKTNYRYDIEPLFKEGD